MTDGRLVIAWQHYCQREYGSAEQTCREILRDQLEDFGSWRLLGEVCLIQEKYESSVDAYRQAQQRCRLSHEDLNNLGVALMALGKPALAEEAYREALSLRPESSRALANLAVALDKEEKAEEAANCYRRALESDAGELRAYHGLASALIKLDRTGELIEFLGDALLKHANCAEIHHALGLAWAALREWDKAESHHRRALALRPDFPEACRDLGHCLVEQKKLEEAVACYRRTLELTPDAAEAWKNLGSGLTRQGKPEEALRYYEKALTLEPQATECRFDVAATLLRLGDYARGWAEFERACVASQLAGQINRPLWDGSRLRGRQILLIAEQGLGDTLQLVRYAPLVKKRGGMVTVACQKALVPLLESCPGIDRLTTHDRIPGDCDVFASFLSLPRIFGTTLDSVPALVPYLHARPELVESWRQELRPLGRFLVGVGWQGNPKYGQDRLRSFPLSQLEPLARVPGVTLVSLQKGPGAEQVRELADRFPIVDLSERVDRDTGPFLDTAAIMQNLDLVIGCDSALVHLAGALGVPVWVALAFAADYRWMAHRDDSPWYPTARLFRQASTGDWESAFKRMADALNVHMTNKPELSRVSIDVAPGELLDKITILEIKCERISDATKLQNVRRELAMLNEVRDQAVPSSSYLDGLVLDLKAVNLAIWQVEDKLRDCEKRQEFGRRFVELARSVYRNNDRRAAIKRKLNEYLGSAILEEKGYTAYDESHHSAA